MNKDAMKIYLWTLPKGKLGAVEGGLNGGARQI